MTSSYRRLVLDAVPEPCMKVYMFYAEREYISIPVANLHSTPQKLENCHFHQLKYSSLYKYNRKGPRRKSLQDNFRFMYAYAKSCIFQNVKKQQLAEPTGKSLQYCHGNLD